MAAYRLLIDPPATGIVNMATDEALLRCLAATGPTLRLYQWSEPTVSLGYFQQALEREQHPPSLACPWVRRHSGGGAIVHDQEVTYSLVLPLEDRWSSAANELSERVHRGLADQLDAWGAACRLQEGTSTPRPFLCFLRRHEGDLLCGTHKIVGSAQRRHRGGLLQHGSLLLRRSAAAPELPGIFDLGASPQSMETILGGVGETLGRVLGCTWRQGVLTEEELAERARWERDKFANLDWSHRR